MCESQIMMKERTWKKSLADCEICASCASSTGESSGGSRVKRASNCETSSSHWMRGRNGGCTRFSPTARQSTPCDAKNACLWRTNERTGLD